ncbi:MAG: ATP-binding protein [Alphaproteobacteria bacterium]
MAALAVLSALPSPAGVMVAALAAAVTPPVDTGPSVSLLGEIHPSWLIAAGALVALALFVPVLLWGRHRLAAAEAQRIDLEVSLLRLEEMLTIAPDGYYCWRYRRDGSAWGEDCSRRLAVLLGLTGGTGSRFADVLASLDPSSVPVLTEAVKRLRADGTAFDIDLSAHDGDRHILAIGIRSETDDGLPLADVVWMRDITEAARAVTHAGDLADDLELERNWLRALIDALPAPVWLRDDTLSLTFCNRAYAAAVEAPTVEEAVAGARELAQGPAVRQVRALAALARASDGPRTETCHLVIGGARRLMAVTEGPVDIGGGASGENRYTAGMAVDVTRVEEVEGELSRHVAAQANVLEKLATAIAIFGADTRLGFHNTAFSRLWRLDAEWLALAPSYSDVLERLREERRLPEVPDFPAFKKLELGRFTSLIDSVEDLMHLPDGSTLRRVLSPHPLGGLQCTYEDVTDRLALERSYNTLIAVQRETLDHLREAVAVFGADGRLRLYNPAYVALWNHQIEELTGEPRLGDLLDTYWPFFAGVADWPAFKTEMLGLLTDRTPRDGRIARSDGSILYYASYPLPDGGEMVTYQDVSDSVRVERALVERNEALRAANRLRTEFIANISCEVRTPLTALVDLAEVLGSEVFGVLEGRQKDYALEIATSAKGLVTLIDDIIDLASVEAGEPALELDAFDIRGLLDGVVALTRERVRTQGLVLIVDCPADAGWMIGDARRIKQVLFTLVGNAVKYTESGGRITLAGGRDGDDVVFTVADTGVGISLADQSDLAGDGGREGTGRRGSGDGFEVGVGLSLVRSFVELHGGRVELRSAAGEGTTVTCRIPAGGGLDPVFTLGEV